MQYALSRDVGSNIKFIGIATEHFFPSFMYRRHPDWEWKHYLSSERYEENPWMPLRMLKRDEDERLKQDMAGGRRW